MEFSQTYPQEIAQNFPLNDSFHIPNVANQEYVDIQSIQADGGDRFGVSAVTFDHQQELLWMGNTGGHVTSYYGPEMQKYTSFQVHMTNEIRQILTIDTGLLSLTQNDLKCSLRRGLVCFNYSSEKMKDMQCMLVTGHGRLLMGGHQDDLLMLDLEKQEIIKTVPIADGNCVILRHHPRFICSGDSNGKVCLRDPSTFKTEHTLEAHTGCLSDFDVSGNLLVTAGFSQRMGSLSMDRFLKVYDLRAMRAIQSLQLMFDPMLLRFMPTFTSRVAVCSQTGQFQLIEADGLLAPQSMITYQVNTAGTQCLSFDCSPSCQALAFGDAGGYVHLFGTNNQVTFNPYSNPTEFADPVEPVQPIHINDEVTPLSSIPMPVCRTGKLLSDWPEEFLKVTYRRSLPIPQQILNTMKLVQNIGYAPKPASMAQNQVPYKLASGFSENGSRSRQKSVPESPVPRDSNVPLVLKRYQKVEIKYTKMGANDFDFNRYNKTSFSGLEAVLPNAYCNCMLQVLFYIETIRRTLLNHLCDKEFCLSCELGFLFHMLENSQGMPCQASNFLRTFRSIPEGAALGLVLPEDDEMLRKNLNFQRLIQSWNRFILSQLNSELMRPNVQNVRAETHSEDEAEIEDCDEANPVHIRRRRFNSGEKTELRHQISKLSLKTQSRLRDETIISKLFGAQTVTKNTCRCGAERTQSSLLFLCFLVYSQAEGIGSASDEDIPSFNFTDVLQKSLCLEQVMQAWCEACNKYQTTVQNKCLKNLPEILVVNCGLETPQNLKLWKAQVVDKDSTSTNSKAELKPCRYGNACNKQQECKFSYGEEKSDSSSNSENVNTNAKHSQYAWLPAFIKIKLDDNGQAIVERCTAEEEKSKVAELENSFILYELTSVTSHVIDPHRKGKDNLVSCIKVGAGYHQRTGAMVSSDLTQWYLFNDFSVSTVSEDEAVWLALDWKVPCFLYYSRKDLNERHNMEVKSPFTAKVFDDDTSLAAKASQKVTFTPLSRDEKPSKGDLVAMDAEFVTINQEEAVLRSDGTRSTIKPCQMSVARITCIRGHGEMEGIPFVDDYISTQEQVVDYLTKFSGIKPGDLDVSISSKHLTTLKSTYKKLRYLSNTNVNLVGHGLKNDFRVINLVVPPEQVHDTVLLFNLPNQRLISLKFLAWHFLGINIQSVTHDSIEDAKTALRLYREYQKLEAKNQVQEALKELYRVGRNLQWKVPETE